MQVSNELPVLTSAICLLANLTESPLIRQQLSREQPLQSLIRILRGSCHSEVTVGLLYVLGRLALGSPRVGSVLKRHGAVQVLHQILSCCLDDEDLSQGASQLLTLLGSGHSRMQLSSRAVVVLDKANPAKEHDFQQTGMGGIQSSFKLMAHAAPDSDGVPGSDMRIVVGMFA